jgi:uncharacterized protein involved in exopolysaccharide biosynthesis
MAMLQTVGATQRGLYDEQPSSFDLARVIGIFRKRIFYFAIPFVLLFITGVLVTAIQRPIYRSEGRILVESPQIPTDLVEPTVQAAATERIQVIQQRLMSRDSLVPIMNKFGLFPSQQQWMSGTQILDLMRERSEISLLDLDALIAGNGKPTVLRSAKSSAVAFTISFEYEDADIAAKVANEYLTAILNEDVRARTNRASETTEFLAQEVKRLQGKLDGINAQIADAKNKQLDPSQGKIPDQLKMQTNELTAMKADLLQKLSVYSEEHPAIRALRKRIAALQHEITNAPKQDANAATPQIDMDSLEQQQTVVEKDLDDASKKLSAARLGESMERNQQAEHLQVLEQPVTPQKPIKPKRLKLFVLSFGLAAAAGFGVVFLAEMLDTTIRGSHEVAKIIDSHLVVSIPYIPAAGELARRRRKVIMLLSALAVFLVLGLVAALFIGIDVDFSLFDRSWIDSLTRLSK